MSTPAIKAVDSCIAALTLAREVLAHQPKGEMQLVGWRELDDGKWVYYTPEDEPEVFEHITLHQKAAHGVSVFAIYQEVGKP